MSYMICASGFVWNQNIYTGLYANEQTFISSVAFTIYSLCLSKALAGVVHFAARYFLVFLSYIATWEVQHLQRAPHFSLAFMHEHSTSFRLFPTACVLAVTHLTVHKNKL